ncbi:MAG: SagB/ThcOx family dehydrogenase [Ilumatobacter sp.]|uniref:SagB/ThcOx family dehydrogenase n=1 Tax=Ilumatobacter sp. TaxID=1967498 RepID=UPI0026212A52|nr:SagB/ThcOx family dehydrogenase [Ilumatobacter sp.]MDJ0768308.1 SagB/ThcOx family dehydrogenase [Ilumatobacter sp.]
MASAPYSPRAGADVGPAGRRVTRRFVIGGLGALIASPAAAGCRTTEREEDAVPPSMSPSSVVDFPSPTESTLPLEVTLRRRRSGREFGADPLTVAEVGQLLWAAQGITADWGGRTAPSAGALYPLELYAMTSSGAMRYVPDGHRAESTAERDLRADLMAAALDQEAVGRAPLVVAVIVVPARTAAKYGDRAPRYADLEAGHAAQNLLLQAVAIGLIAVPIGAFDDEAVGGVLQLPDGQEPRYLLAVGHPPA